MNGLSDVEILQGLGYAGSTSQGALLASAVDQMSPERKQAAMAKIVAGTVGSFDKSPRDMAVERMDQLPKEIVQGLLKRDLQLVETEISSVKLIKNKTQVNFFLDADTIAEGFTNLNNGKLKKDEWFLACGLQYTEGVGATSDTDPTDAFFTSPAASTSNGDFDFKANGGKLILNERTPLSVFTDVGPNGGYLHKTNAIQLTNPKWIEPQVKIEFNTRFAKAVATNYLFGRVKIIGIAVITL